MFLNAWSLAQADLLKKKLTARAGRSASQSSSRQHGLGSGPVIASKAGISNFSKADSRPAQPETDFEFFRRHPNATIRNRLPFENEFDAATLDQGGLDCFVRAIVERKPGRPIRRARWLLFVQGGHA
jgi:hypothetical protein